MASNAQTAEGKPPIVFKARGLTADVRLQVFDTEFHVHSTILKLHSAFFFKFLDSPDKQQHPVPAGPLKYEWVTKIDEGGSWGLVAASSVEQNHNTSTKADTSYEYREAQVAAFKILLSAIYGLEYKLVGAQQLIEVTGLADYYCALPKLSSSLLTSLIRNPLPRLWDSVDRLFIVAYKLRHPELFRECLVVLAGQWDTSREDIFDTLEEPKLRSVVRMARGEICYRLVDVQESTLLRAHINSQFAATLQLSNFSGSTSLPEYYRVLSQQTLENCFFEDVKIEDELECLAPLLKSNLFLQRDVDPAGTGDSIDYFLCAEIADEDLPWDLTQLDW